MSLELEYFSVPNFQLRKSSQGNFMVLRPVETKAVNWYSATLSEDL